MGIRRVGSCLLSARRTALKEPWLLRGIICHYLVSNTVIAHYAIHARIGMVDGTSVDF